MKRFICLLGFAFMAFGIYAQDANVIMSDFISKTNFVKHKDQTLRLEMEMDIQGNPVPMTISFAKNQKDMRIDMSMQNNDFSVVIVGDEGWMEAGEQCQDLPADFIAQTRHPFIFTTVSDLSNWNFSYLEKVTYENKEYHKIQAVSGKDTLVMWMDVATGLLDYIDVVEQGSNVKVCFSDYKQFADVFIPSTISTSGVPQMNSSIKISNVAFGIDIPAWYFERP